MDIYTMDRGFRKQEDIDSYDSAIWTERYKGDGDFKLVVPKTSEMRAKLPKGVLMGVKDSDQPMIAETIESTKEGQLAVTGIALPKWLNNRFIRSTASHIEKTVVLSAEDYGDLMAQIVQNWAIESPYLNNVIDMGVGDATVLKVPGLDMGDIDHTGPEPANPAIPFGPLYDALREIADVQEIGMRIRLTHSNDLGYEILFDIYRGADRTSDQSVNPLVLLSPDMDSFADTSEIQSIENYKTIVHSFAATELAVTPTTSGLAAVPGAGALTGFDLRALMTLEQDITDEAIGGSLPVLNNILQQRALQALTDHKIADLVDGELVQTAEAQYGVHYFMGDIIEVESETGARQKARITEYIRSKDSAGERAYPTLAMMD